MTKALTLLILFCSLHGIAQIRFVQPNMKKADEPLVYLGINNYFVIQNAGKNKILSIQATEGKIERLTDTSFHYQIKTTPLSGIQFSYNWVQNGKLQKNIHYPVKYTIAEVPNVARLRLGTKSNGKISLTELKMVSRLALDDRELKTRLVYNIICEVSCKPVKSAERYVIAIKNSDLQGNADYQELLGKLNRGDKIYFDKIKVIGNTNTARPLESVAFTIE